MIPAGCERSVMELGVLVHVSSCYQAEKTSLVPQSLPALQSKLGLLLYSVRASFTFPSQQLAQFVIIEVLEDL